MVEKFNGEQVENLAHITKLVTSCNDPYYRFDLASKSVVVIDRKQALQAMNEVMGQHSIQTATSLDLQQELNLPVDWPRSVVADWEVKEGGAEVSDGEVDESKHAPTREEVDGAHG